MTAEGKAGGARWMPFGGIAVFVIAADLFTKWLAFRNLPPDYPYVVIPRLLYFRTSLNAGAVWGIGQGKGVFFAAFTIIATLVILWCVRRYGRTSLLLTCALGLVEGGALGNLYDRLAIGHVRDFILVYLGSYPWPTFNVADMAISTGAGLIVLYSFLTPPDKAASSVPSSGDSRKKK